MFISIVALCGSISYSYLGCDSNNFHLVNGTLESCDMNCNCDSISYTPICDIQTNVTFFSPCHAGCKSFDAKQHQYTDCSCSTRDKPLSLRLNATDLSNKFNDISSSDKIWLLNASLATSNNNIRMDNDIQISPIFAPGACENNCNTDFMIFSFVSLFVSLLTSTGKIGQILIEFR